MLEELKQKQCQRCNAFIPLNYTGLYCPIDAGKLREVTVLIWQQDGEHAWVVPAKSRFSTQLVDEESDH